MRAWAVESQDVARELGSNPNVGLSPSEAKDRLEKNGPNLLREEAKTSRWIKFLGQFKSPVVLTLLLATLVSALLGEIVDAIAIVSIVIINAVIGYAQEAKAEAAIEALKRLAAPKARVLRSGLTVEIPAADVVLGDILVFEAGDYVAADARLLQAHQLSADEALLTGESLPVTKDTDPISEQAPVADRNNMIFAGTAISTGTGRAVVTATGMSTEVGHIANLLQETKAVETPLQSRLEEVGSKLLVLCGIVVALVALLGLLHGEPWLDVLLTAISLAVAAIPEGLPAVVTLALALAIHRMARRNAIVRQLQAVETLGSTDVVCTDKTGTLTTGKMRVREVVLPDGETVSVPGHSSAELETLIRSSVVCSNAAINPDGQASGDPTEVALLILAQDNGLQPSSIQASARRVYEWSFDSTRKRMSVAVSNAEGVIIHTKGAPEAILPLCLLEPGSRAMLESRLAEFSAKGRRMLAVTRRELHVKVEELASESYRDPSSVERDLTFLGLIAIADPPRPESIEAIKKCKAAGIQVVMITGDHPVTAKAIAQELGIVEPRQFDGVLTGTELESLSLDSLTEKVIRTAVYARVAPEHKLRIVEAWKARGSIVAMTGDGVNDAPALKAASIGVSMGKGGTEVARQASSIVLADDNFATIVGAVEEGRAIFGNIRRTIQYLLSGNLAEILIMLGAALLGWEAPLTPIHLLWINLVTDGLPSLALAAEPVPQDILETRRKPSPKNIFDPVFYKEMTFVGVTVAVMALTIYGISLKREGALTARTHVFSFLVFAELFRSFASRSETKTIFHLGPFSNVFHLLAVGLPILFQLTLHQTTWFLAFFKITMLTWGECLGLIGLTLIPVTVLELRKWLRHRAT